MRILQQLNARFVAGVMIAGVLMSTHHASGQGRNTARAEALQKESQAKVFGANDPDFDKTDAPDKWKGESAVVLCQKMKYSYLRDGNEIIVEELFRRRVLLQDKASVDEFSTFYFVEASSSSIGIKIIKPDGSETKVKTSDAVSSKEEIPSIFRSYYKSSSYKKLAIPNLEVGDIIDYFYTTKDSKMSLNSYSFPAFHFTLSPAYPIFLQRFDFIVDRGFFINFNSYHGAPQIAEGGPGVDAAGRTRATIKTYYLEDLDRESVKEESWSYARTQFPSVKFQVSYQASGSTAPMLLGQTSIAKKEATPQEVCALAKQFMQLGSYTSNELSSNTIAYLRKNLPQEKDPLTVTQEAYGHLRYQFITRYYGNKEGANEDRDDLAQIKDNLFAMAMKDVLEARRIPVRIVVAVPRAVGHIKDVLLASEIDLAVMVEGQVIFPFNNMSHMNDIDPDYQGTEAYAFTYLPSDKAPINAETITIPVQTADMNRVDNVLNVDLSEEMNDLRVARQKSMTGGARFNYAIALRGSKYIQDERLEYDRRGAEAAERGNKARLEEEQRRYESQLAAFRAERDTALKKAMEDSYRLVDYGHFELVSPGRTRENPVLTFKDRYVVKDLVNKAGPNYMLSIGKLMGEQTTFKEEERKSRQSRVDLSFPLTVHSSIQVKVPAGYTVEGLDALSRSITNAFGSLTSSASLKDGTIVFEVTRVYAKASAPKEDWPAFVEVADGAFNLAEAKVVLRKQR